MMPGAGAVERGVGQSRRTWGGDFSLLHVLIGGGQQRIPVVRISARCVRFRWSDIRAWKSERFRRRRRQRKSTLQPRSK
jgi:hypothetical protein